MTREIKFRAWDGKNIIGNVVPFAWDAAIKLGSHKCLTTDRNPFEDVPANAQFRVNVAIKSNIKIMQYTGLKDKNDAEIYEGDILQIDDPDDTSTCSVVFEEGSFKKKAKCVDEGHFTICFDVKFDCKWYKVIGNIHQNPELLDDT